MSSVEQNKRIARRFLDLVSEHHVEALCRMVAPSWRMQGGPQGLPAGPDGLRELFRTFGEIDQTWTIDDIVAEEDKVVVRATNRCVQESFLGVPSHGRPQTFSAILIHRIADGKIVETWRNADDLGRLLQLGLGSSQRRRPRRCAVRIPDQVDPGEPRASSSGRAEQQRVAPARPRPSIAKHFSGVPGARLPSASPSCRRHAKPQRPVTLPGCR